MAKKSFKTGLENLIQRTNVSDDGPVLPQRHGPADTGSHKPKSTQAGCLPGESRVTYILNEELQEKIKDIAHHQKLTIKEAVTHAFTFFIQAYERKHGPVEPRPAKPTLSDYMD